VTGPPDTAFRFNQSVRAGKVVIGTWIMGSRTPSFIRLIAAVGFDFVLIDTQHVGLNEETLADLCEVAAASGIGAVVRLSSVSAAAVNKTLDLGAAGVICPDCRTPATALEASAGIRFPPAGRRSAMGVAPGINFRTPTTPDDLEALERASLLAVQVESVEGLSNLDAILETGVVDLIDVGRGDLAIDYGDLQNSGPARALQAIDQVLEVAKAHRTAVGTTCSTPEEARAMIERGVTVIGFSSDRRLLEQAYRNSLATIRTGI
jgi:4-hydroxy-2-oxoheptanedioate aldolase